NANCSTTGYVAARRCRPCPSRRCNERKCFADMIHNREPLSVNGMVVGQASRLPPRRLAPESIAGETPAQTAGTAAPLPTGFSGPALNARPDLLEASHEPAMKALKSWKPAASPPTSTPSTQDK